MRPPWRRWQAGGGEQLPHRGCRDGDAEVPKLTDDLPVAPGRVLAREPQDELAQFGRKRRSARPRS
jgi:hypothetical protein